MSDRNQGAVQTGTRPGQATDAAPPAGAPAGPAAGGAPLAGGTPTGAGPLAGGTPTGAGPTVVARNGSGRPAGGKGKARGPRRARLQLRHIDTWSALKISLVLSIALFFIWMIAVAILYGVLAGLGVFDSVNDLIGQVGSDNGEETAGNAVTPGIVFFGAAVIGAINIVLMTALCTVAAFIYNLCSDLVGGLEVTLSERD
jgi:hypothetical protein